MEHRGDMMKFFENKLPLCIIWGLCIFAYAIVISVVFFS